jgi:hypothetical protein
LDGLGKTQLEGLYRWHRAEETHHFLLFTTWQLLLPLLSWKSDALRAKIQACFLALKQFLAHGG